MFVEKHLKEEEVSHKNKATISDCEFSSVAVYLNYNVDLFKLVEVYEKKMNCAKIF